MSDLTRAPLIAPISKRRADQVDVFPNLLLSTLALVATTPPFVQRSLEQPIRRNHYSGQTEQTPSSTYTLPTQFAQPRAVVASSQPERKRFTGQAQDWPNATYLLAATGVVKPFQNPDFTQWQRRHHSGQSDEQDVGGGATYLKPANIVPPFTPVDWPTVARGGHSVQETSAQNLTLRLPASTFVAPFLPQDWTQPKRNRHSGQSDEQDVGPGATQILPVIVAPEMRAAVDSAQWQRRHSVGQTDAWSATYLLPTAGAAAPPFTSRDWTQLQRRSSLSGQFGSSAVYLPASQPQAPVVQPVDWPQPAHRDSTAGQYSASLFYQLAPGSPPFFAPLPPDQPRRRKQIDADQQRNVTITLPASVFVAPFLPVDWPQVPHKAHWQDSDPGHNVTLLLPASVFVPPFLPIDWPQPRRPKQQIPDDWLVNVTLRLPQPVFVAPFLPVDWPVVLTRHPAQQTETHNQVILATLTMPVPWADTANQTRGRARRITQDPFDFPNLLAYEIAPITVFTGSPRYVIKRPRPRRWMVSATTYLQFDPMGPDESQPLTFDFTPDLPAGVLLTSIDQVAITVDEGVDSSPATIANGAAGFDITQTLVIVPVRGQVDDVKYKIHVRCSTTDSRIKPSLTGLLQVTSNA